MENTEDISKLKNMKREEIIQLLKTRYDNDDIYTYCGPILLSINPYKVTKKTGLLKDFAEKLKVRSFNNKTVIVSGESGSGKTTLTHYLFNNIDSGKFFKQKIVALSNILEAFGNGRTVLNNNSSRFGKFLSLLIKEDEIKGFKLNTYLLEESRVVMADYNYNIFYMFIANYNISIKNNDFISKMWKLKNYNYILEAFKILNLQDINFEKIITAILFLGSLHYSELKKLPYKKLEAGNSQSIFFNFLHNQKITVPEKIFFIEEILREENLFEKLLFKKITIKNDVIIKEYDESTYRQIKNNIAKSAYLSLFKKIIRSINKNLQSEYDRKINILDIYGFEIFKENGFEQFCINWANEKIHNEFIKQFYEKQLKILQEEDISVENTYFERNDELLELIENKLGIVDICNEEALLKGNMFHTKLENFQRENKSLLNVNSKFITLKHYVKPVSYIHSDFISKNITVKNSSVLKTFQDSLNTLFKEIENSEITYVKCIRPNNVKNNLIDFQSVEEQYLHHGIENVLNICRYNYFNYISSKEFTERYEKIFHTGQYKVLKKKLKFGKNYVFFTAEQVGELEGVMEKYNEIVTTIQNTVRHFIELSNNKNVEQVLHCSFKTLIRKNNILEYNTDKIVNYLKSSINLLNKQEISERIEKYKEQVDIEEAVTIEKELEKGKMFLNHLLKLFIYNIPRNKIYSIDDMVSMGLIASFYIENKLMKNILKEYFYEQSAQYIHNKLSSIHLDCYLFCNLLIFSNKNKEESRSVSFLFKKLGKYFIYELENFLPKILIELEEKSLFSIFKRPSMKEFENVLLNYYNLLSYYAVPQEYIFSGLNYLLQYINYKTFNHILLKTSIQSDLRSNLRYNLKRIEIVLGKINYVEGIYNFSHLFDILKVLNIKSVGTFDDINLTANQINKLLMSSGKQYSMVEKDKSCLLLQEPSLFLPKNISETGPLPHKIKKPDFLSVEIWEVLLKSFL